MLHPTRLSLHNPSNVGVVSLKARKLGLKGAFVLGGVPGAFAGIDVLTQGARLRVEAADGSAISDVTLPPGAFAGTDTAGWQGVTSGKKWTFRDKTDSPVDGITLVKISDRSVASPNLVRLKIRGLGGRYPLSPLYLPLRAGIRLGDVSAATAGLCGETAFAPNRCEHTVRSIVCEH
jgi:hypothetical protein